jgi:hypothetical protein
VLAPDAGEVRWRGQPMNDEIRRHVGYLPEDHGRTFSQGFAAHRIEPADRGDGRWRDVPRTCRMAAITGWMRWYRRGRRGAYRPSGRGNERAGEDERAARMRPSQSDADVSYQMVRG